MNYKVSIIIPTYKRSSRLSKAIKSCLNQTYKNIEIIVVDDNDPNSNFRKNTSKIMEIYSDYKNVKYIKTKKNLGGAAARNLGLKYANGDYIAFLDDDDEFLYTKIEKQLRFMIDNNLDVCFSNQKVYDEISGKLLYEKKYSNYSNDFTNKQILIYHLTDMIVGTQTFMYRKSVLDEIGGFDIVPTGHEYVLMYKTIMNGFKVGHLDETLVKIYSHNDERISTSKDKLKGELYLYNIKKRHFQEMTFKEKKKVKYQLRVNCYRFYKNRKSLKQFVYFLLLLICHPKISINTMLSKLKRFRRR